MTDSLRDRIAATSRAALASGALRPTTSRTEHVTDAGTDYVVHVLDVPARATAPRPPGAAGSPFLQPEAALIVEDTSPTHRLILNKYNVLDQHALLVTRTFEEQESALTRADFDAAARCLDRMDALLFYNAGPIAGASQRHKHLQLVPLPASLGPLDSIPQFAHVWADLDGVDPLATYDGLRAAFDVGVDRYNLLWTRHWMVLVPRAQAEIERVPVNALGFAGTLLARTEEDLATIRRRTPSGILKAAVEGG